MVKHFARSLYQTKVLVRPTAGRVDAKFAEFPLQSIAGAHPGYSLSTGLGETSCLGVFFGVTYVLPKQHNQFFLLNLKYPKGRNFFFVSPQPLIQFP